MIAGVKGSAVLSALLILLPWSARAADDMAGAVRELARKTAALAGRGEPVSVTWRNISSLPSGDFNQARIAFEAALREAGVRPSDVAPVVEARLTISSNPSQFLIVEESRKADDRQVWIAAWKRPASTAAPSGLRSHARQEAGLGTGRADPRRRHGRSRRPCAFTLPYHPSHRRHGPIPAPHAAASLAARPPWTPPRQRRRLQSLSAGHGVQRRHRPVAHHGVPPQRRALDPRRRPARRAPRQLRSCTQLLRWTRRHGERRPQNAAALLLRRHRPKRADAPTSSSPCSTAARRSSTPRSTP